MPLAFPSHPGLVAPLWRRWPARFDALGCALGAAAPDIVDGLLGAARGHLGQWYGHSLLGLFVLDVPVTLLLVPLCRALPFARVRALRRAALGVLAFSAWIGALSHIASDFVSHETFMLLLPWVEPRRIFPEFWYARWFEVPLPGYREPYPIGPHFAVWTLLTVVGAVLFFSRVGRRPSSAEPQ